MQVKPSHENAVVVLSGGMDSTTLLHEVVNRVVHDPGQVRALTVIYGQRHDREIEAAVHQALILGIHHRVFDLRRAFHFLSKASSALTNPGVDMPTLEDVEGDPQPATYVPNRNMMLLSIAVSYAESIGYSGVFYGAQAGDRYGYWDCQSDFVIFLNRVLRLNPTPVQIYAPYLQTSKTEILRRGFALGVDYARTWSCYRGEPLACGECPSCGVRLGAFEVLGRPDPLPYKIGGLDVQNL